MPVPQIALVFSPIFSGCIMILPPTLASYVQPSNAVFSGTFAPDDKRMGHILASGSPAMLRQRVALLGVPQDIGVQRNGGRAGAAKAPEAVRRALYKFTPFAGDRSIEDALAITDTGDIRTEGVDLEEIHERQSLVVAHLLSQGCIPVVLGGGHDIAWPDAVGFGAVHSEFGVINLDPHTDVRPLVDRSAHSGSPFRQVLESEELHVPAGAFAEFGTQRFAVAQSHIRYLEDRGMHIVWYHDIRQAGFLPALEATIARVSDNGRRPLYVSFDMDSVHSADAPGVSATAPIGFTADELCRAAWLCGTSPAVGMIDIAETNPEHDVDSRTAKLAALLIMHFLGGVAHRTLAESHW